MEFNIDDKLRANIKALTPYKSARSTIGRDQDDCMYLDANENPFDTPWNRYPDPYQSILKSVIAEKHNVRNSQVILGNGSDEVIDLLLRAFCEPKEDEILIVNPGYSMYEILAQIQGVGVQSYWSQTVDFEVNRLLEQIRGNTKMIFLCNPDNPTGSVYDEKAIKELLNRGETLVVIDEAYIDFASTSSLVNVLNTYPNLIVLQTLSKAYGMAGIRLGMGFASETIVAALNKIKLPYNISSLTQKTALKVLNDSALVDAQVREIIKERSQLWKVLNGLSFVRFVYPSETNFILMEVDDAALRYQQILERGIVVRNRHKPPYFNQCLRITVGTPDQNRQLISQLKTLE